MTTVQLRRDIHERLKTMANRRGMRLRLMIERALFYEESVANSLDYYDQRNGAKKGRGK